MAFELTHARHDPTHCLAPGLFQSLKRGERKTLKLDVTHCYGQAEQIRFIGFEPLGPDDMRLLQGLVALAGPKGVILTAEPTAELPQRLRLLLDPKLDALYRDGLVVRAYITKLLNEIGLTDGGPNISAAKASLIRMSNVTLCISSGGLRATSQLMSHVFDERDGALSVCLNSGIADAVLGRKPYARIDLAEVRRLRSDAARLIHHRLCGWIDPGKSRQVALNTLCGYIWPREAKVEAMRKRRTATRKALAELVAAGWSVDEYAKGKWNIHRPAATP